MYVVKAWTDDDVSQPMSVRALILAAVERVHIDMHACAPARVSRNLMGLPVMISRLEQDRYTLFVPLSTQQANVAKTLKSPLVSSGLSVRLINYLIRKSSSLQLAPVESLVRSSN